MDGLFENGEITCVGKAAVLADMVMRCSPLMEPISFGLLHHHIMQRFGVPEEQIGGTIIDAAFLLERSGLIKITPKSGTIGSNTMVQATRSLTDFVWDEGEETAA